MSVQLVLKVHRVLQDLWVLRVTLVNKVLKVLLVLRVQLV
jgi:hypothetical protein